MKTFLVSHKLISESGERLVRFCWCTDGPWDICNFVLKQCFISKVYFIRTHFTMVFWPSPPDPAPSMAWFECNRYSRRRYWVENGSKIPCKNLRHRFMCSIKSSTAEQTENFEYPTPIIYAETGSFRRSSAQRNRWHTQHRPYRHRTGPQEYQTCSKPWDKVEETLAMDGEIWPYLGG